MYINEFDFKDTTLSSLFNVCMKNLKTQKDEVSKLIPIRPGFVSLIDIMIVCSYAYSESLNLKLTDTSNQGK